MGVGLRIDGNKLWKGTHYDYRKNVGDIIKKEISPEEQMSLVSAMIEHYKIDYIEDPFRASDFMEHAKLTHKFDNHIISGASLYNADIERIKRAYKFRPTNCITINPKELFTVSRLSDIYDYSRNRSIKLALSRGRSETGDSWVSDLSVAFSASILKLGVTGAANTEKYSRLMGIWEEAQSPRMGMTIHH